MREYGRIKSKISDRSISEGRRSSPCPCKKAIDGVHPDQVDSGAHSRRDLRGDFEGDVFWREVIDIFLSDIFCLVCVCRVRSLTSKMA